MTIAASPTSGAPQGGQLAPGIMAWSHGQVVQVRNFVVAVAALTDVRMESTTAA